jgi:phage gpG-like protein
MKVVIKSNFKEKMKELAQSGANIKRLLPQQIFRALTILEAQIKQNIRTTFTMRTGTLLNSVQKDMVVNGNEITGTVGPENVPYAAIHEYGGTIPERFVAPRHKLALKWTVGNKTFFSKGHTIPSFEMPKRPYVAPAIEMSADKIERELGLFIEKELEFNR